MTGQDKAVHNTGVWQLHIFIIPSKDPSLELVSINDSCHHFAVQVNMNKFLSSFSLLQIFVWICQ